MNIRASASFRAGDASRFLNALIPRVVAGVTDGCNAVLDVSRQYVPVDTGELVSSGGVEVELLGQKVQGAVSYTSGHAAYNEFGTGRRGEASGHGGPGIEYNPDWPGMPGHPYLRPAIDVSHEAILDALEAQGFTKA